MFQNTNLKAHVAHYAAGLGHPASIASAASFINQLHRLQCAQADAAKASVLCQSDDYDRCHLAVIDERVEAYRLADALGIDLRLIGEAMR